MLMGVFFIFCPFYAVLVPDHSKLFSMFTEIVLVLQFLRGGLDAAVDLLAAVR